jgi:hypothetical protein
VLFVFRKEATGKGAAKTTGRNALLSKPWKK